MIKNLLIKIIKFYQKNISINKPARCRFYPTCSDYGVEALEKHGAIKGFFYTICRFLRCNPLFKGGYDPVPDKKRLITKIIKKNHEHEGEYLK